MGISKSAVRSASSFNRGLKKSAFSSRHNQLSKSSFAKSRMSLAVAEQEEEVVSEASSFEVNQKVFCPGYGVGQIEGIETRKFSNVSTSIYMIRILDKDITLMKPVDKMDSIRPIVGEKEVTRVYKMLKDKKVVVEMTTWNRRSRQYNDKLATGCIFEITEVLRDLCVLKHQKVLSFGEKQMLDKAKSLLVEELAIAEDTDEPTIEAKIEELFAA